MFGFFKRTRGKTKISKNQNRMISEISEAHSKIEMLIRAQTRMLKFFYRYDMHHLYEEEYFRFYIYGAYDAATMKFGLEARTKIGLPLIRIGLTKYLGEELANGNQSDALEAANAIIDECLGLHDIATNPAIIAGGVDGSEFLSGRHAQEGKLLLYFASDHAPVDQHDVDSFLRFMAEDDLRLKRIREN